MYFSINPLLEYYQGFNDIAAVLLLCFTDAAECVYFLTKVSEIYFKKFLLNDNFQYELARVVSSIETLLSDVSPFRLQPELIKVFTYSKLRSQGNNMVFNLL